MARLDLDLFHERARRDEIILFYEDETVVRRFALLRRGWERRGRRYRLPLRPLSASQIKRQEASSGKPARPIAPGATFRVES